MEVIARPQKYTSAQIDNYYKTHVQGKNAGGKAVHKADQNSAHNPGKGRFAVDLLNREQASTGVRYVNKSTDSTNRDAAVDDVATALEQGKAVPLIVGQQDGETAHYVLAVSVHPGTTVTLRPELSGMPAFAVATQLDEAMASPQEVALTFEMLKQVLGVSEGGAGPAGERFLAASREALDHVARLLSKVNNIVLDGWLEDCAPFVKTEADIQAFIALFQAVLQQYTALQAVKPSAEGA